MTADRRTERRAHRRNLARSSTTAHDASPAVEDALARVFAPIALRRVSSWLVLGLVLLVAAGLRTYRLGDVPDGLFCDEAAIGYNAFTLGSYGVDEHAKPWPLYVWSFGGYKNPVFIYTAIVPIKIFGRTELGLRLTSALFGVLTVAGVFWLAYELWGKAAGLLAAALLAITPWHLHFSRIAFELISFPCLFVLAFAALLAALRRGGWRWVAAGALFGITLFTYAIATVVVPSFLLLFLVLHLREVWRGDARRWFLAGAALFLLLCVPFVWFQVNAPSADGYFKGTSFVAAKDLGVAVKVETFLSNYATFFGYSFLFEDGDPLIRHSPREQGELHKTFLPIAILGIAFLLAPPRRAHWLIIAWILLFPVGAALMNEIPSASRSFIGSPLAPLVGAYGLVRFWGVLSRVRWAVPRFAARVLLAVAIGGALAVETHAYLDNYYGRYHQQSARGYGGFQFGYREVIEHMEPLRERYPQRLLTATEVNNPWIFVNFYNGVDPHRWAATSDNGYRILVPEEYGRYDLDQPTLYALRDWELSYFSEYDVQREVVGPDGVVEFVVAEVRARKSFLPQWSAGGLLEADAGSSPHPPKAAGAEELEAGWRVMANQFVFLDFNRFHASDDRPNPEDACAEAVTWVLASDDPLEAQIEVSGSEDSAALWLNGASVMRPQRLERVSTVVRPIILGPGWNQIALRACEGVGDWFVRVRLADREGRDLDGLQQVSRPPQNFDYEEQAKRTRLLRESSLTRGPLVEGFADPVSWTHESATYSGHRGEAQSYWIYAKEGAVDLAWRTAPSEVDGARTYAFTASSGEDVGLAALAISGRERLEFQTGVDQGTLSWERDGFRLEFVPRARVGGLSGYYLLTVPAGVVQPGRAAEISVRFKEGGPVSWFMIKAYTDTLEYEDPSVE